MIHHISYALIFLQFFLTDIKSSLLILTQMKEFSNCKNNNYICYLWGENMPGCWSVDITNVCPKM